MREKITGFQEKELKIVLGGVYELHESYCGGRRVKGYYGKRKRGRGIMKQPVFGIYERSSTIYTEIVPIYRDSPQLSKSKITSDGTMKNTFTFYYQYGSRRGYDGLVDIGYDKHCRVNHSKNDFIINRESISIELKHTEVIQKED